MDHALSRADAALNIFSRIGSVVLFVANVFLAGVYFVQSETHHALDHTVMATLWVAVFVTSMQRAHK